MEATDETVQLAERIAALDIGKASLMACIRVPNERTVGRRRQEVTEYATTTGALLRLADRLRELGVTRVAMEATSDYWKPVFYLLEAEGFQCRLLNATHVRNVPGRPKTDKLDAVWLAKVVKRGMCAPSFVPPQADPPAAGPHPLPPLPDPGPYPGEATAGEAPRGRPDQTVGGGLGHVRRLRPGHPGRADRRATRPPDPG
ncbi:transposase [Dactylosporangium sp. NPDC049140]|uniref:IS110 family transposase n=1 Tax=Dactylosporangium sp. NPDC049140 TaxID=3155647 RepID=UPI0033DF8BF7